MNNLQLSQLAAVIACNNAFWKSVESLFASIGSEEKSYLSEQVIKMFFFGRTYDIQANWLIIFFLFLCIS